ncbi:DoxX family protein [Pelistega europaea]|uniref:DoxX family protein n=1 Tax=Pelistega europaea TaxID=106147 RepID=A0A7Y4LD42_9BURK|nr:DoxX family protein [Pelistega europaea]NOL50242.1 DoxX family protein [Pelistega europaea]
MKYKYLNQFSTTWGKDISLLILRLFVAYEFIEAGLEKWGGENWFAHIQEAFPIPFNWFPVELNWQIAMWAEIIVPVLLVIGLFGRIGSLILFVLTLVAWYAVHSGNGYNVCHNGYKMAVIYLITLIPLAMQGMGRFSLDYLICSRCSIKTTN